MIRIQETKSGLLDDDWVEDIWGGIDYGYTQLTTNGKSGGILLIWDKRVFTCKDAIGDERFIAVKGSWPLGKDKMVFGRHLEKIDELKSEAMRWELEAERRPLNDREKSVWMEARKQWEIKETEYDPRLIEAEMARRYKSLFSEGRRVRPKFCCDMIEKISMDDARNLEKAIDEKEIWEAIRCCGG
ncbi:hypothetical protein Tco_1139272 [Tanacetum coccineum]